MQQTWSDDALADSWTLLPDDTALLANKSGATRLGFAILLRFFQNSGRFPQHPKEVPSLVVEYVAGQVGVPTGEWARYDWGSRAIKYHRSEIREHLGFREATNADADDLTAWLASSVLIRDQDLEHLKAAVVGRCRELRIEPPSTTRVDRLVRSAVHIHEEKFCTAIAEQLSPQTRARLDELLEPGQDEASADPTIAVLHFIKADPGRANLESIQEELAKLRCLREIDLPIGLFASATPQLLRAYRQRVAVEEPCNLRRHPDSLRATLLAAFCFVRGPELVDALVDLLISTVHRIEARAERKVDQKLLEDYKRVAGKNGLLFKVAEASLEHPDGVVRDVVYPIIGEETLQSLVKEWKATGPEYRRTLQTVIRKSYLGHYRRMVPALLGALRFRCNNDTHRPIIVTAQAG